MLIVLNLFNFFFVFLQTKKKGKNVIIWLYYYDIKPQRKFFFFYIYIFLYYTDIYVTYIYTLSVRIVTIDFVTIVFYFSLSRFIHNVGLMAPMPGMVAPGMGVVIPGPHMLPMMPRYRWSPQGPPICLRAPVLQLSPVVTTTAAIPIVLTTSHQPQQQMKHQQIQFISAGTAEKPWVLNCVEPGKSFKQSEFIMGYKRKDEQLESVIFKSYLHTNTHTITHIFIHENVCN